MTLQKKTVDPYTGELQPTKMLKAGAFGGTWVSQGAPGNPWGACGMLAQDLAHVPPPHTGPAVC